MIKEWIISRLITENLQINIIFINMFFELLTKLTAL
jgi:hypothetical protein